MNFLARLTRSCLTQALVRFGVLLAVLAVIGIGSAGYMGFVAFRHVSYAGPFKAQMAAFLAAPADSDDAGPVKGKLIVLDKGKQDFDWDVSFELANDLKASKPEEVGTVALTDWRQERVDEYTNGAGAYQYAVDVTVVDHARRTVIGKCTIKGSPPPQEIKNAGEGVGSKPTKEIVAYLRSLPRQ